MPRHTDDLRLFVAVYPPAAAAGQMLSLAERLDLPPHRVTPAEQVHLTLAFLGRTRQRDVQRVIESIERSVSGLPPFPLRPMRLATLPEGEQPRLLALTTDAPPALLELVRRLTLRLVSNPRQHPADRFLPHFTLLRFDPASSSPRTRIDAPAALDSFTIDRVHLMQSVLLPAGAQHRGLASFALHAGG